MFRGLFIGVNRYSSPIPRLSCARSDAEALGALFSDTMGGKIDFLIDEAATKEAITEHLEVLTTSKKDDLVVISFAGHGTVDHRLVPVDANPSDLTGTCISLDELATKLDSIPAKQMIVFLDCCFSGGFGGARVFAPTVPRSLEEDRSKVEALVSGDGRVVVTASGAGEPSLETTARGHGIFTYHLIEGLQGAGNLISNGRIGLLDLVKYVAEKVIDEAQSMQEKQTPTLYGSIVGVPSLTALKPGELFASYFPHRARPPVTKNWNSLSAYDLPKKIVQIWSSKMPEINPLQLSAINKYKVLDGRSLLVISPTGAGKTMIGELSALSEVAKGSRAVLLLPLKALVNDKYEYFTTVYKDEVTVVRATGDTTDQVGAIVAGQYDIALLTYEKFMSLALGNPHILRSISLAIVDEIQNITDQNRGASLEFVLTLLRSGHSRGTPVQIVALSAVIGATNGLEKWLGGDLLRTTDRPIPLTESVLDQRGDLHTLEPNGKETETPGFVVPESVSGSQSSKPWIIPLVRKLVADRKKVIVFRSIKAETVGTALYLSDSLALDPASTTIGKLPSGDISSASDSLKQALQGGVGFHNSDLDRDERLVLESEFRDGSSKLRVLVATTTLAMGINTPAEAVVVAGLTHPGLSPTPYSISEYKNMAGRAGRVGHGTRGEAFIVATGTTSPTIAWERYIKGSPEEIKSHFLSEKTDPKTMILRSIVALGVSVAKAKIVNLLENSFAVWQRKNAGYGGWDTQTLESSIRSLIGAKLIKQEDTDTLTLTELGRYAGESGIEVESVIRISTILNFLNHPLSPNDLITLAQLTCEMEDQYIPANTRSYQEKSKWPSYLTQAGVDASILRSLGTGGVDSFKAAKRAVACLMYITDTRLATIESTLLQHHRERAAAGSIRGVANRTRDVIEAVINVAVFSGKTLADAEETDNLGIRLENGIPSEMVPIAKLLGSVLSRAHYLSLKKANILHLADLKASEKSKLDEVLGEDIANMVLNRVKNLDEK